jgi:hypothetical protein
MRLRSWIAVGAVAATVSALAGWHVAGRAGTHTSGHATIAKVVRGGGERGAGVMAVGVDGRTWDVAEGATVPWGTRLETSASTRARVELDDGTAIALDRATALVLERAHALELPSGAIVTDVAAAAPLVVTTRLGRVTASDARFSLAADETRTSVGVARGDVDLRGARETATVHAGEEGDVARESGRVEVTATTDLAQRLAFGEGFEPGTADDAAPAGLGELRARKPGSKDEIEGAVRLARHDVVARVVGAMARTEVDETFVNTTGQELEGIWRFPLPPDARLERLALEVDGKLVEGEFVDANRAAGIWRGVIQHAAPSAPRPVEEIVWVPGRWRDPALLEWQRGGRAELKIFPIPRNGSRRVVLAYTQHVAPIAGVRRYVYPLATRGGPPALDEASFDVQVLGSDPVVAVRAHGYDLSSRDGETGGSRLLMTRSPFAPSGDLVVEYATADRASEASAFAYAPPGGTEDGFVALTLRPRLPARIAERGRDQVLVVDVGRAMFGERLRRAARLAVTLAQQMDRRDRVTLLACDLECRAMPGGWHAPGAAAAHDVDAFLAGIEADGASDLVGAVRAAAAAPGRDAEHDLRVVLLSDGVANAGYRAASRVSVEVGEALPDARAEVVAVPVGSDADVDTLGEIARAGGGALVPYAPGRSLDAAAVDVLAATYGAALRDVEITLPDGLRDVAPARPPSIRAGSEAVLGARLRGDRATGDVVLRGKLAGAPFEARWPIDVRATSDEGNAWAARTWAALRVADDERAGDESARAEAVSLSHRFRVPSRTTSLLVLESEAMFHAFGIARAERAFEWSGESEAQGTESTVVGGVADGHDEGGAAGMDDLAHADDKAAPAKKAGVLEDRAAPADAPYAGGGGGLGGKGRGPGAFAHSLPAPVAAAPTAPARPAPPPAGPSETATAPPAMKPMASVNGAPIIPLETRPRGGWRGDQPGRWMRRVWFRVAAIAADDRPPADVEKIEAARAALTAAPDARQRHADLAKLLVRQGSSEAVEALAARWTERDPLDADALVLRATAKAWRGDRDGALRVLSGILASPSMSAGAQADLASTIARAEERAGRRGRACALRVAAAEGKPTDVTTVASAVACERADGRSSSEARWLASLKDDSARARASAAAAKLVPGALQAEALFGDVVVDATWDASAGVDLDAAIVDPSGKRLAWASGARNVRASDCTSLAHEVLAVSSGATGSFLVEVVRADGAQADVPIRGKVRVTALGQTQTIPFVVMGGRAQVARIDVRMDSRLEPLAGAVSQASCVPPFFVDQFGVRRMKPGCL